MLEKTLTNSQQTPSPLPLPRKRIMLCRWWRFSRLHSANQNRNQTDSWWSMELFLNGQEEGQGEKRSERFGQSFCPFYSDPEKAAMNPAIF